MHVHEHTHACTPHSREERSGKRGTVLVWKLFPLLSIPSISLKGGMDFVLGSDNSGQWFSLYS